MNLMLKAHDDCLHFQDQWSDVLHPVSASIHEDVVHELLMYYSELRREARALHDILYTTPREGA